MTGKNDSPEDQIDKSLAWMQVGLSSIDAIKVLDDGNLTAPQWRRCSSRARWVASLHIRR
ncbi:hypothetical protein [Stenotrophomonas indicatrix]|uniref:hypothetical protein n=1 Tax=Stenotrophomonas indicatrix TaxID=2045451 RepID=UPI003CCCB7D2